VRAGAARLKAVHIVNARVALAVSRQVAREHFKAACRGKGSCGRGVIFRHGVVLRAV
jgi:hypothetical protein